MVSPDTSTLYVEVLIEWTAEFGSLRPEGAVDCVLSVTNQLVSNVTTRIVIRTYKFRAANKTFTPLRIFVSRNPEFRGAEFCETPF